MFFCLNRKKKKNQTFQETPHARRMNVAPLVTEICFKFRTYYYTSTQISLIINQTLTKLTNYSQRKRNA